MEATQDYMMITVKLLGALALLIFGMKTMSESLQKMAGPQLRHILSAMTNNRFTGLLTGTFVTCAVQSSSATTVMSVSFVSAGLLTLSQAISVIMGANIGTTLTAWIISLGYNVDLTNVVFPAFAIGIILIYSKRHRNVGDFLFGIAFMFFSLVILSNTGKEIDLEHNASVTNFFASFDTGSYGTILLFLAIGTVITCIAQSSAAIMAITIMLCSTGVLPIHLGIALVMGENIGTTTTANLAALGANTEARRAALAHLLFNLFGVAWIMIAFFPFVDTICNIVGYDATKGGQAELLPIVLAMFHTCFNVTNTAILIGFIPQMERIVCYLLPSKESGEEEQFTLQYIQANIMQTPELSVLQAQKETAHFAMRTQTMFGMVKNIIRETDAEKFDQLFEQIKKEEEITDKTELSIAEYLSKVSDDHLSDDTKTKIRQMMREIGELESIGDACYNIARTLKRREQTKHYFADEQSKGLNEMMSLCDDALTQMNTVMHGHIEEYQIKDTFSIEEEINTLRNRLKQQNIQALNEHKYDYTQGTMYTDVINEMEKLGDYVVNVVEARFGNHLLVS